MIRMMTRAFGLLSILAVLAVSGYAFVGNTSVAGLSPIGKVSDAESRADGDVLPRGPGRHGRPRLLLITRSR